MGVRKQITIPEKYNKYKDEDGRIPLWSYSKVSSAGVDSCSWEYYLGRIKKLPGVSNSYAILGGFAHDILEEYYNGNLKYEQMKEQFETKWLEAEMAGIKLYNDEEKNEKMMEEYKHDILNFFETHRDLGKVLTERELWVDVNGNVFFGYSDALTKKDDGYTYIIDWKTSTLYKGDQIRQHQHQLLLYALALEEMGIPLDKIKICWNFLKYTNVTFKHMTTVTYVETVKDKSKTKTSTCLKSEWVSKVKTQLKKDLQAYDEELTTQQLKELVNECVENNSLETLPKEIQDKYVLNDVVKTVLKDLIDISKYVLEDAYVYGIINDETVEDLKRSLCENIEIIKANGEDEAKWERLLPIGEQDSFYCSVLCSQRKNCKYYDQYKKQKEMYTAEGCVERQEMSNDSLLDELMNL